MVKQITSWSFSRYLDYRQCPLKAKLKHIDRIKEPEDPTGPMARGAAIHKQAEEFIKGRIKKLPPELKLFKDDFKAFQKQFKKKINGMAVEETWAFTKDWDQTRWDDWKGCWLRIKLDLAHHSDDETLVITDWKTGKLRPEQHADYVEQLELYAMAALILHPHIKTAEPRLVYLDLGSVYPAADEKLTYTQDDVPGLKKTWMKRTKKMLSDKTFAPRPNDKCRWCFYQAANKSCGGGQCKF